MRTIWLGRSAILGGVAGFFPDLVSCETLYNWLAIQALSVSPVPLFPRFTVNTSGEEWPTAPRLLKIREWLQAHEFKLAQSLKAEVGPGMLFACIRLPRRRGADSNSGDVSTPGQRRDFGLLQHLLANGQRLPLRHG